MALPLVILAVGAILAGGLFRSSFIGEGADGFWHGAVPAASHAEASEHPLEAEASPEAVAAVEHQTETHADVPPTREAQSHAAEPAAAPAEAHGEAEGGHGEGHHPPVWVLWAPFVATMIGLVAAWWAYIVKEGLGARMAARGGPLHSFLYNKWYFDEIYHFVFVRGAKGLGDLFWKIGDMRLIDGLGPNGVAGSTLAFAKRIAAGQSGYLYHYAFVMLIGILGLTLWVIAGAGGL